MLASARRLLLYDAGQGSARPGELVEPWKQSCERLRLELTPLLSREGFQALASRAAALTRAECPEFEVLPADGEDLPFALEDFTTGREAAVVEGACVALLAHLLGLLVMVVGEELTRELVAGVWPNTSLQDIDFGMGEAEG